MGAVVDRDAGPVCFDVVFEDIGTFQGCREFRLDEAREAGRNVRGEADGAFFVRSWFWYDGVHEVGDACLGLGDRRGEGDLGLGEGGPVGLEFRELLLVCLLEVGEFGFDVFDILDVGFGRCRLVGECGGVLGEEGDLALEVVGELGEGAVGWCVSRDGILVFGGLGCRLFGLVSWGEAKLVGGGGGGRFGGGALGGALGAGSFGGRLAFGGRGAVGVGDVVGAHCWMQFSLMLWEGNEGGSASNAMLVRVLLREF